MMIFPHCYTNNFLGLGRARGLVLDWTELDWRGSGLGIELIPWRFRG